MWFAAGETDWHEAVRKHILPHPGPEYRKKVRLVSKWAGSPFEQHFALWRLQMSR